MDVAAIKTERAFVISEQALEFLKDGINHHSANLLANLLVAELGARLVVVTDTDNVLASVGSYTIDASDVDAYLQDPFKLQVFREAVLGTTIKIIKDEDILNNSILNDSILNDSILNDSILNDSILNNNVPNHKTSVKRTIIVPFNCAKQNAGSIILNFQTPEQIGTIEIVLIEGLGRMISYQLSLLEAEKLRILLKDTEVRSLQAQINPHFLFNTLNTIVSLIRINPEQARMVMVHLANFMRMNLKMMSAPLVSLEQELILLEAYIQIVKIRFEDQLTVIFDVEQGLEFFKIPPATIQPLLENSIRHGLKRMAENGKVIISIKKVETGALVTIADNGSGIPPEILTNLTKKHIYSRKGNGIGVYNVNQRLISLLGDESQLQIRNIETGGCEISFLLPIMQNE